MKRHINVSQLPLSKCIDQKARYEGRFDLSELPRLCQALVDDRGQVVFKLRFDLDEQGHVCLKGHCEAEVLLVCERCLHPMPLRLTNDFEVGIVDSDEKAKRLPKRYEPVIIQGETFDARAVLEDELILSLPMYAMHDDLECAGQVPLVTASGVADPSTSMDKPFGVLAQLKKAQSRS